MTDALLAISRPLFRYSVLPSLTAIACLACMENFGLNSGLHIATASATFVFCSTGLPQTSESNAELVR